MTHLIPTGRPRLDAAIRAESIRQVRRQWAANVTRFDAAGMSSLSLDDAEATPEDLAVVYDAGEDVLRDITITASYDAAKRILARLVGFPETVEGPTWAYNQGEGWDTFGFYLTVPDGTCWQFPTRGPEGIPADGEITDPREALIAALLSASGDAS
jgi:hypothetical protein